MHSHHKLDLRNQKFATLTKLLLASVFLSGIVGCGGVTDRAAVSGEIKFAGGEPIAKGTIEFSALDGELLSGAPIVTGHYYVPRDKGLKPGKYRVRIHAPEQGAKGASTALRGGPAGEPFAPKELAPPRYNSESKLEVDVPDTRAQVFNFTIEAN